MILLLLESIIQHSRIHVYTTATRNTLPLHFVWTFVPGNKHASVIYFLVVDTAMLSGRSGCGSEENIIKGQSAGSHGGKACRDRFKVVDMSSSRRVPFPAISNCRQHPRPFSIFAFDLDEVTL